MKKRDLIHKDLQPFYLQHKVMTYAVRMKGGVQFMNFANSFSNGKQIEELHNEERYIPSRSGGPDIRVRIYRPKNYQGKLPVMLFNHGGGYILGNPEMFSDSIKQFIATRPCMIVAPDYRRAYDAPYPAAFDDCYDTLLWVKQNADDLNVFNDRFMVVGHSAGGGLTAAVTLKARDTKELDIAFQMPIYPMIDDRQNTTSAKQMTWTPAWNSKTSKIGWDAYLKGIKDNGEEIPSYAAPARNNNYKDFPPTITFVGDMEPFKDETIAYVEALKSQGIATKFKLYEGAYHGFEVFAPNAPISKDALAFTYDSYAEYYDRYVRSKE